LKFEKEINHRASKNVVKECIASIHFFQKKIQAKQTMENRAQDIFFSPGRVQH
jgi:hypothetical protein